MKSAALALIGMIFCGVSPAFAQWGAEAGVLYLTQDNDGNTTTVLPMLNYKILTKDSFILSAQVGGTAYRDESTDKTFLIGVLRVNPEYQLGASKFSIEGLIGVQSWESKGTKLDLGARLNFGLQDLTDSYVDQAYLGGGVIDHENKTTYYTLGVKKWF
ncbi:hypothetical protein D3C87_144670 [compost metagenome]